MLQRSKRENSPQLYSPENVFIVKESRQSLHLKPKVRVSEEDVTHLSRHDVDRSEENIRVVGTRKNPHGNGKSNGEDASKSIGGAVINRYFRPPISRLRYDANESLSRARRDNTSVRLNMGAPQTRSIPVNYSIDKQILQQSVRLNTAIPTYTAPSDLNEHKLKNVLNVSTHNNQFTDIHVAQEQEVKLRDVEAIPVYNHASAIHGSLENSSDYSTRERLYQSVSTHARPMLSSAPQPNKVTSSVANRQLHSSRSNVGAPIEYVEKDANGHETSRYIKDTEIGSYLNAVTNVVLVTSAATYPVNVSVRERTNILVNVANGSPLKLSPNPEIATGIIKDYTWSINKLTPTLTFVIIHPVENADRYIKDRLKGQVTTSTSSALKTQISLDPKLSTTRDNYSVSVLPSYGNNTDTANRDRSQESLNKLNIGSYVNHGVARQDIEQKLPSNVLHAKRKLATQINPKYRQLLS